MKVRRVLVTARCDQQGGRTDMSRGGCSHLRQCLSYARDNSPGGTGSHGEMLRDVSNSPGPGCYEQESSRAG